MNHASRGTAALEAGRYPDAVEAYTLAIAASPTSPDYHIKRSMAYARMCPPDLELALADAGKAVLLAQKRSKRELIAQAQLRRAIILFKLDRFADSKFLFEIVKELDPKEKSVAIWENKIDRKLPTLEKDHPGADLTVQETPADANGTTSVSLKGSTMDQIKTAQAQAPSQTPASKITHQFYQCPTDIVWTLLVKGAPTDQTTVDIQPNSLSVSFPLVTGATYELNLDPLFAEIVPAHSSYKITATKVEVTLRKARQGQMWRTMEGREQLSKDTAELSIAPKPTAPPSTGPAYPTSSRSGPKNWDKLVDDIMTKKPKTESNGNGKAGAGDDDDDDYDWEKEGGDEVNSFFKKLYAGASDDTRRAMMKSFTESNGTALSTNWSEVSKGPVATQPPEGIEAKPWKQ